MPALSARDAYPPPIRGRVAVVGPCASGKSTLVAQLLAAGYDAHHPAQEHSYVPDMWLRLTRPEMLVYLDVSLPALLRRRQVDLTDEDLAEQRHRLAHARSHCDLYVATDDLTPAEVYRRVIDACRAKGIAPSASSVSV